MLCRCALHTRCLKPNDLLHLSRATRRVHVLTYALTFGLLRLAQSSDRTRGIPTATRPVFSALRLAASG